MLARRDLLESLSAAHPEWPHSTGASGEADMPGGNGKEFLLRVPEIEWGSLRLRNVLFVSRPNETYSTTDFETSQSIVGALAGNVLSRLRVEIDYPHGKTYLEEAHEPDSGDMDSAGLVLDLNARGQLVVLAESSTADTVTRKNVRPGDIIVRIAGKREKPWAITDASQSLSGRVGKRIDLLVLREGVIVHTSVIVAHLL
jgi:C-terminal processing protease CtpA/Prc